MLKATPFLKKKIAKEVEILDDEMSSRYEKIHGNDGLCHTLWNYSMLWRNMETTLLTPVRR